MNNTWIYIFGMALVTYLIRVLPLTLIRKEIKNKTIRSFLYYLPYVTLSIMTFPAILYVTEHVYSGLIALVVGIILAWRGKNLFVVSVCCSVAVLIAELVTLGIGL